MQSLRSGGRYRLLQRANHLSHSQWPSRLKPSWGIRRSCPRIPAPTPCAGRAVPRALRAARIAAPVPHTARITQPAPIITQLVPIAFAPTPNWPAPMVKPRVLMAGPCAGCPLPEPVVHTHPVTQVPSAPRWLQVARVPPAPGARPGRAGDQAMGTVPAGRFAAACLPCSTPGPCSTASRCSTNVPALRRVPDPSFMPAPVPCQGCLCSHAAEGPARTHGRPVAAERPRRFTMRSRPLQDTLRLIQRYARLLQDTRSQGKTASGKTRLVTWPISGKMKLSNQQGEWR